MPLEGEAYAGRAFVVGLSYAPVPSKMASKITIAVFIAHVNFGRKTYECKKLNPICVWMAVAPARK